jgi:hypothetical protein
LFVVAGRTRPLVPPLDGTTCPLVDAAVEGTGAVASRRRPVRPAPVPAEPVGLVTLDNAPVEVAALALPLVAAVVP